MLNFIKSLNIDFVIVFGSSIIPDKILKKLPKKIFNLHLGIVQNIEEVHLYFGLSFFLNLIL